MHRFLLLHLITTILCAVEIQSNPKDVSTNATELVEFVTKSFYVITVVYNPARFSTRYELYEKFAEHIEKDCGVQLVTIEAIFPSIGQNEFKVTDSNNPHHIQIRSKSVLWLKENLINIAVSKLPKNARYICWLDSELEVPGKPWVESVISALQEYAFVQIFEKAEILGPKNEVLRTDYSFGYSVVHSKVIDQRRYHEWYPHPGFGWASKVSTFRAIGGLPEYDIVGSGDLHFAYSLLNRVSNALEKQLHPNLKSYILHHSHQTYEKLVNVTKTEGLFPVGYVPFTIAHHFHGSTRDRQYVDRWNILIKHKFSFKEHCGKTSEGLVYFLPGTEKLQKDVRLYFQSRNEDSAVLTIQDGERVHPTPRKWFPSNSSSHDIAKRKGKGAMSEVCLMLIETTNTRYDTCSILP